MSDSNSNSKMCEFKDLAFFKEYYNLKAREIQATVESNKAGPATCPQNWTTADL